MTKFSDRYLQHIKRLKQSASQFSQGYPALTEHLSRERSDPDVEMILQGVAYISAEFEAKIAQQFPVALQALSQAVVPNVMQPTPCVSMQCLSPQVSLKAPLVVAKGTCFETSPILTGQDKQAKAVRFQTVNDITVLPFLVSHVAVTAVNGAAAGAPQQYQLSVQFDASQALLSSYTFTQLPFFFNLPFADGVGWFQRMTHQLDRIVIENDGDQIELSKQALKVSSLTSESSLFNPNAHQSVHSVLQEYFLYPEQLLCFQLDVSAWRQRGGGKFVLNFIFNGNNEAIPALNSNQFKLFCLPVINRFSHYAEPVQMADFCGDYPLIARQQDIGTERSLTIIEVVDVESIRDDRSANIQYQNVNSPNDLGSGFGYHYYRSQGLFDQPIEDRLALQTELEHDLTNEQVLRVKVDCCHGARGEQVNPGDINRATNSTPELIDYLNLTGSSQYLPPLIADDGIWQVVSDQASMINSKQTTHELIDFLMHHVPIQLKGSAGYQTLLHKINGIKSWQVSHCEHIEGGQVYRGIDCQLVLLKEHFINRADCYLFAYIVRYLMLMSTAVNCGVKLSCSDDFSGESFHWPFVCGAA